MFARGKRARKGEKGKKREGQPFSLGGDHSRAIEPLKQKKKKGEERGIR